MPDASICTVHTDVNDDNEDSSECSKLVNKESGEDDMDGVHRSLE